MKGIRLTTAAFAVLASALLAANATAEKPTVVRAGNMVLRVDGRVTPRKLPKQRMAPAALHLSGGISTVDGSQPSVAKTIVIDFDKHGAVNAKGLPVCRSGQLQARDTRAAKAACPRAIVGHGSTTVRVAFPDQRPFNASGPLVLFNGGVRGGVTTMFIHAYVSVPTPTAIVSTVKIKRIRKGRFGTRTTTTIPTIAGGSGALTRFNLVVQRRFKRHGKAQSYLLARCLGGRFYAHGDVLFSDGNRIAADVVRSCIPR